MMRQRFADVADKGCLEQYTSATGIVRMANIIAQHNGYVHLQLRNVQYVSAKEVFDAAKQGDAACS